ncbi:hypothetical protein PR048_002559 [Dryococelus australis]|uniref:FMN hydroxy acid dehydrogenase domain-containing protein n=1 Tax=Dryococelus australis TaxID=614101 RepID=A0ABQ9IKJ4_9NEOP|nr:hypothetical protein PR048_002559 [Dryococelus australis]
MEIKSDQCTLFVCVCVCCRLRIRPRCLNDVSRVELSTCVLGQRVSLPVGISPTAMQGMAHPDGECASAKAASDAGAVYILSTLSTCSIEEVATAAPLAIKWFQLYIYKDRVSALCATGTSSERRGAAVVQWLDYSPPATPEFSHVEILPDDATGRELTLELVRRVERAGFTVLVLTVDAPIFGIRRCIVRNEFKLPSHLRLANFTGDCATEICDSKGGSGINEYALSLFDPKLTWEDVKWLKSITKLPIVLKGILTAEDAIKGADLGVAAIFVSNHGGRQVDGAPAAIEALPEVVRAVGDKVEVYMDGGVTQGTDVFKALALGARMAFVGRPALWGLAHSGERGVANVLSILQWELETTFQLTGNYNIPAHMELQSSSSHGTTIFQLTWNFILPAHHA